MCPVFVPTASIIGWLEDGFAGADWMLVELDPEAGADDEWILEEIGGSGLLSDEGFFALDDAWFLAPGEVDFEKEGAIKCKTVNGSMSG